MTAAMTDQAAARGSLNLFKSFIGNLWGAYKDGWRVARALPLVVLLMIAIEFAQHVVEVKLGMFVGDPAVRKAAAMDPLRMMFGWPKMMMVWALGFFAIRYLALGDARAAMRPTRGALALYAGVVLFQLIPFVAILYAEPILAAFGIGPNRVMALRLPFALGQQLLEPALCLWFVQAAVGNRAIGPIASARATGALYFWALPLLFLARTPANALHQLLNRWPAGQEPGVLWPLLAIDAVVVVAITVVISAAVVRVARFVEARRGTPQA